MSPASIAAIAVGMSVDSFVAALGQGASSQRRSLLAAVQTGAVFGLFEMLTPLIGWCAGLAASEFVQAVDHWIAFGLLAAVGGRLMLQAVRRPDGGRPEAAPRPLRLMALTALGTSVDALAVGVSLAFLDANILVVAGAIGAATFVLTTCGVLAGRTVALRFGRPAEFLGGLALLAVGATILATHLGA